MRSALLLLTLATGGLADVRAEPLDLKVTLGTHYSVGDYGTAHSTQILYVPLTTKLEVGRWTLRCIVPYLSIVGPAGVVQGPNGPVRTTGDADGLGDVLARGSYTLPSDVRWIPWVDLTGVVKFPTASERRGLGTGEFDSGIETEVTWVGWRLMPFAYGGYRFLGGSADVPLDDVFLAGGGAQYRVLDRLHLGLLLDWRAAASSTSGERMELVPFGSWRADPHWTISGYASAGLADGSPDAGVGLEIGYSL